MRQRFIRNRRKSPGRKRNTRFKRKSHYLRNGKRRRR